MRPIDKSLDQPRAFASTDEARITLINMVGRYCSYCERYTHSSLALEHIKFKKKYDHLLLEWDNFLLACSNCNSSKLTKEVDVENTVWPHIDNTLLYFQYQSDGIVTEANGLDPVMQKKTRNMLALVGLEKDDTASNIRIEDRKNTYEMAEILLYQFEESSDIGVQNRLAQQIVTMAKTKYGGWSIWMHVFQHHPAVRQQLIDAFPGTARQCFDAETKPLPR